MHAGARIVGGYNFCCIVVYTYPFFIFDVNVSSLHNKVFHYTIMSFSGCNMQGSPLVGKKKQRCYEFKLM